MACFHGGAFWGAIGEGFADLSRREAVVNADVLDAWFPPAPEVLAALAEDPGWQARTSPPTYAEGLVAALAAQTGIDPGRILAGGGSSALVFLAFRTWLKPGSKVLVLDPSYGEYAHVAEVAGASVHRFSLTAPLFELSLEQWVATVKEGKYDLVVMVNPNNPTGQHVPAQDLAAAIQALPPTTKVWVDEAYAPYAPASSLDLASLDLRNLFVVRSMSKAFALSGLRVAYLVGPAEEIAKLRDWTPPWAVSLPAQIAAVAALSSLDYYEARYEETAFRRRRLANRLREREFGVENGVGNWVLARMPADAPTAQEVVREWATQRVFVRDAGRTSPLLGDRYVRVAVRPDPEAEKIFKLLRLRSLTP
jgi:histidinol-phosphate/aromatic aminotransferase/cobyric acid decarboxylase-like protein